MTSTNRKPRSWGLTLIVSGAALAYALLVFLPGQRSIRMLRAELQDRQKYVIEADRLSARISETESDLRETQQFVQKWRDDAPREAEFASFMGGITKLADASQVVVQRFNPLGATALETIEQHPLELVLAGGFQEISSFLKKVEGLPSTVWVTRVHVEPASEDGAKLRCELTLVAFTDNRGGSD